ncbi:hypothetical protein M407DRAFT_111588 [Tulasnella calospora MUT 4182]|uniref:Anaphase-promoting complex subunit 4 WD40 domain-containing protein n=1 Tax=Tulasnella calospora MUT 4182 TaxID=1051891 RepID=A0A0C3QSZ1_9AGAM|nr:hypothetical protein M407DRAFT_111588 [Tulasnella calospora MUT 4182]
MSQNIEYAAHQGFRIAALSRAAITPTPDGQVEALSSVAYFPFNRATIEKLSVDTGAPEPLLNARAKLLDAWKGVMAVARGNEILLLQTSLRELLVPKGKKLLDPKESLKCVAWAIDPQTFGPLLLFAGDQAIIYAWDPISNKMKGIMRGHGGPIYDIAVLPTNPFIFASASRDKSVRVHDLTLQASSTLLEAAWPITASTKRPQSERGGRQGRGQLEPKDMIGAIGGPFGSQVSSSLGGEGLGSGKCFLILRGNSKGSGGHNASVLAIAFHPSEPFIATAGVDNCVKIWRVPEIRALAAPRRLIVQDKPVFSSSCVHESYVTSIYWLSPDVLASKSCGPNATVVLWKWLELQRFSPKDLNASVRHLPTDYNDNS